MRLSRTFSTNSSWNNSISFSSPGTIYTTLVSSPQLAGIQTAPPIGSFVIEEICGHIDFISMMASSPAAPAVQLLFAGVYVAQWNTLASAFTSVDPSLASSSSVDWLASVAMAVPLLTAADYGCRLTARLDSFRAFSLGRSEALMLAITVSPVTGQMPVWVISPFLKFCIAQVA
jgi:hypothetical protein